MSIYVNPLLAGAKIKGVNGVPRGSDASGAYQPWYTIGYQWGTSHVSDPWNAWIKPQINLAHALGFNGFRFFLDASLRISTSEGPTLTAPQLAANIDQMATYLASLGMWFYPCLTDGRTINHFSLSVSPVESYLAELAAVLTQHVNIFAIDCVQEIDDTNTSTIAYTNAANWIAAVKGALTKPIPVTCSLNGASSSSDLVWSRASPLISAGADFADFHVYYDAATADIDPLVFNAGSGAAGTTDSPVMIGEMGSPSTDTGTQITNRYTTLAAWANHARIQATFVWAMVDMAGVQTFGVYTDHQDGSDVFDTPRSTQVTKTGLMPIVPAAYNAAEDDHATLAAAPSVTPSSTSVAVSVSAASGPGGTVTYTGQSITRTATGLPDLVNDDWHDDTPTTSTGFTVTGLRPATDYVSRVKVVSADGGVTYSRWTALTTEAAVAVRPGAVFAAVL